jgi:hypothetical protein
MEMKKYLNTNENESRQTICQNLWDPEKKSVLKGKFTVMDTNIKKEERLQTNSLILYFRETKKKNELSSKLAEEGNNQDQSRNK